MHKGTLLLIMCHGILRATIENFLEGMQEVLRHLIL